MTHRSHRRPGPAERTLLVLTTVVVLTGVSATAWIAVRGALAYQHLTAAQGALAGAEDAVEDPVAWADRLSSVEGDVSAAHALTDDPIWAAASALPWIGPQLRAASGVAAATDRALGALGPLRDVASAVSSGSLRSPDGRYDLALLASWESDARTANVALADAASEVSSIDLQDVLPAIAQPVTRAQALFTRAGQEADALSRATRLLPEMLGADGRRSYLVLFQNSAEWRSLGGVVGAVAQIDADDGRLALTAQASSTEFRDAGGDPIAEIPEGLRGLFDDRPARYVQNVTQVPDFAMGASLAREMWRRQSGADVDGVIAVDPVALSYLLRATGPVSLPSGDELTSENILPLLLDEVYRRYADPARQDAFFQATSAAVFAAVADGRADPRALVEAVSRAGEERRLLVWNADPTVQEILDGTTLEGGLPESGGGRTAVGIYLNDGTGSKMDYYMHVGLASAWCSDDSALLRLTLRNASPDPATLPDYVTGAGTYGVPIGQTVTGAYIYLPPGARLESRDVTGTTETSGYAGGEDHGREVVKWSVRLAPGQSATLAVRMATPVTPTLEVLTTPILHEIETPAGGADCGSAG